MVLIRELKIKELLSFPTQSLSLWERAIKKK